ncbi:MAG: hydrogenase maturation protease [Chitinispirillaceae bacterium]|nr:hydrogenase maturation protease [Chitinispirillaceae bacterium]
MTEQKKQKILFYGFGNPGRRDDGLGIFFISKLEKKISSFCDFERNYQLNVEDALLICNYEIVVFVDATVEPISFKLSKLQPHSTIGFSTHEMHPSSIVALCNELYSKYPNCYLLEIGGKEWDFGEGLSEEGKHNMEEAKNFILSILKANNIHFAFDEKSKN